MVVLDNCITHIQEHFARYLETDLSAPQASAIIAAVLGYDAVEEMQGDAGHLDHSALPTEMLRETSIIYFDPNAIAHRLSRITDRPTELPDARYLARLVANHLRLDLGAHAFIQVGSDQEPGATSLSGRTTPEDVDLIALATSALCSRFAGETVQPSSRMPDKESSHPGDITAVSLLGHDSIRVKSAHVSTDQNSKSGEITFDSKPDNFGLSAKIVLRRRLGHVGWTVTEARLSANEGQPEFDMLGAPAVHSFWLPVLEDCVRGPALVNRVRHAVADPTIALGNPYSVSHDGDEIPERNLVDGMPFPGEDEAKAHLKRTGHLSNTEDRLWSGKEPYEDWWLRKNGFKMLYVPETTIQVDEDATFLDLLILIDRKRMSQFPVGQMPRVMFIDAFVVKRPHKGQSVKRIQIMCGT